MALKTHVDEQPSLNLTSMIDVVFLLIVFFMVGTKFNEMERKIPLKLPQVSDRGALSTAPEKRVVNVYRDGGLTLDGKTVSLPELTASLTTARQEYDALGVIVRGDGEGHFQQVAEVLNACKQAGIGQLAIALKTDSRKR